MRHTANGGMLRIPPFAVDPLLYLLYGQDRIVFLPRKNAMEADMGAPLKVLRALEKGDLIALRAMRKKAARTRAENAQKAKKERGKRLAEEDAAQDWYEERRREEEARQRSLEPAVVRRDHLLPKDELPF